MQNQFSKVLMLALACAIVGGCAATATNRSTGEFLDDKSIATSIKTALLASPDTDGLNIDVEVDRNKVQLNGFVDTSVQRSAAVAAARNVDGVVKVVDNMAVR